MIGRENKRTETKQNEKRRKEVKIGREKRKQYIDEIDTAKWLTTNSMTQ